MKPTNKITGVGLAGALSVLLVWLVSLTGVTIPEVAASAITTVIAFVVGFWVTDSEPAGEHEAE